MIEIITIERATEQILLGTGFKTIMGITCFNYGSGGYDWYAAGNGYGDGYGYGLGSSYGHGTGHGFGNGSGDGDGDGHGDGYGYP